LLVGLSFGLFSEGNRPHGATPPHKPEATGLGLKVNGFGVVLIYLCPREKTVRTARGAHGSRVVLRMAICGTSFSTQGAQLNISTSLVANTLWIGVGMVP